MSDLVSAAQRLRDSVDALPQLPVQGELEPWRYFTDRGTAPPGEHMDMLDLGPRSLILGWGDDELRPAEGRHVALTASPRTVTLLADLLAAIAEHDQANDPHDRETCFIDVRERADALASAILHTDQPEG